MKKKSRKTASAKDLGWSVLDVFRQLLEGWLGESRMKTRERNRTGWADMMGFCR